VHTNDRPQRELSRQGGTVTTLQWEQSVQPQPWVIPLEQTEQLPQMIVAPGVHTPQEFTPQVWIVQLQFSVNAQPCVFSTQSSVTPPQLVMNSQCPPGPSPTLIIRSRTRKRGMALSPVGITRLLVHSVIENNLRRNRACVKLRVQQTLIPAVCRQRFLC
jgi:hypothetical protein